VIGSWWGAVAGIIVALLLAWIVLVAALAVARPRGGLLSEAVRILPDVLRLLRRLAADRTLPRGIRVRLGLLLAYLAMPIDLIPDFIPVLGYADDAIVVTAVLRSVVRRAGIEPVRAHWPGTDDGFATLCRLTGLSTRTADVTGPPGSRADPRPRQRQQGQRGQHRRDRADRPDGEVARQRRVSLRGVRDRAGGGGRDREDRRGQRAADGLGRVGHAGGEAGTGRRCGGRGGGRQGGYQRPGAEPGHGHVHQGLAGAVVEGQPQRVPERDQQAGADERVARAEQPGRQRQGERADGEEHDVETDQCGHEARVGAEAVTGDGRVGAGEPGRAAPPPARSYTVTRRSGAGRTPTRFERAVNGASTYR
jgi:uncharacterized membrane protein YkvA (DUF1232 family)